MTSQNKVVLGGLVVAGAGSENETDENSGTGFDEWYGGVKERSIANPWSL
jgi:hypothetical protein